MRLSFVLVSRADLTLLHSGVYDIRHPYNDPTPPDYFVDYLNQAEVQQALGVALNYTQLSSAQVGRGFWFTGDDAYRRFSKCELGFQHTETD